MTHLHSSLGSVSPRLAQSWLDAAAQADGTPEPPPTASEQIALAWALKDACYEAWSSSPPQTVIAAQALASLATASREPQVQALAAWTGAIAALVHGDMERAARSLDAANLGFGALRMRLAAAQTQVARVMALAMLGRHDEALRCAQDAYAVLTDEGDLRTAGKLGINLGSMHLRRDEYDKAVGHYQTAAVLLARAGDREGSVMADIGLADAMTWLGDFDEAQRLYDRARMRTRTHAMPVLQALVEGNIGWLELARGRHREALRALEASYRRFGELQMPQRQAIAEQHLADGYLEVNLLPEAIALYERAIVAFTMQDAPDDLAWTQAQLGRALTRAGADQRSELALDEAARGYAGLDNRAGGGTVRLWQAELALHRGDAEGSIALAEAAATALAAAGLQRWCDMAQTVKGDALLAKHCWDEASDVFVEVLQRQDHYQLAAPTVRCRTGLGLAAQARGETEVARQHLEEAVALNEQQRAALPSGEMRIAFQAQVMRPYEALLALSLASPGRRQAEEVLMILERCRARALLELGVDAPAANDADGSLGVLRDRVRWLHCHLGRPDAAPRDNKALREQLVVLERDLLESLRRQRLSEGDIDGVSARAPLDLGALLAALGDDTVLVEYGQAGGELFACTTSSEGVRLWRGLAKAAEWTEALRRVRFQIDTMRHGTDRLSAHAEMLRSRSRHHLGCLYDMLWRPLEEAVALKRRAVIVPCGALHYVPFAALYDGHGHLVERHDLAVSPSAAMALRRWRQGVTPPQRVSAFGTGAGLAHAEDEARRVGATFEKAIVFTGAAATSAALRDTARNSDLIHIACHAAFRPDSPVFSTLHLADGALTLLDLQSLAMGPATVVLSGCETGLGALSPGDDLTGLVSSFIGRGAARVVASHWPVDDGASAHLMNDFYTSLSMGQPVSAALSRAQRSAAVGGLHPFYWAAFAVHGGP